MDLAFDLSDHPQVFTAAVHAWFSDLSQCMRGPGIDAYFKISASPLRNGDCRIIFFLFCGRSFWVVGSRTRRNLDGTDEVFLKGDTEACLGSAAEGCGFTVSATAV